MKFKHLHGIDLSLFDGGAAGGEGAGAAAPSQGDAGATGEAQAAPADAGRGEERRDGERGHLDRSEGEGRAARRPVDQPEREGRQPSDHPGPQPDSTTLEARRKQFQALINGEFKDIYTEETQRIIDRRFKETRGLQEQLSRHRPIMEMLMQRYRIPDGDPAKLMKALESDDAYWNEMAEEAGMNVEQYKQFQKLQRENDTLRR